MPALKTTEGTQRFELENGWEFLPDPSGRMRYSDLASVNEWREARAGVSWNVQFDDLREYMGAAWYRIHIDVPAFTDLRHVLLKFGAVDYFCEVFVNGQSVGIHEGGYTPFTMEITHSVRVGENDGLTTSWEWRASWNRKDISSEAATWSSPAMFRQERG
jgi:beta-galactosidase/beta-glucuronidase